MSTWEEEAARVMDKEANIFAMELLMPRDWLLADLKELGSIDIESDPNIKRLAKRYQVSEQIMIMRIVQLSKL